MRASHAPEAHGLESSKTTIVTDIIELHNEMLDAGVPEQITLVIARSYLPALKLSTEWAALDSLGGKTLPKGTIGEFDGMPVKPMTTKKMPANVPFMLIYKGAVISPMKINDFKGHVDPPGLSGDLLEFRMMYDAFVLGKKASGVAVAVLPGFVSSEPTIELNSGKVEIGAASGSEIRYTVDGSDPRYSTEAKIVNSIASLGALDAGTVVRACAKENGKYVVELNGYKVELSAEKQEKLAKNNVEPQDIVLGVRPEHITLEKGLCGVVDVSELMGSSVHLHVNALGRDVVVVVSTMNMTGAEVEALSSGTALQFNFPGHCCHVFNKETGINLEA